VLLLQLKPGPHPYPSPQGPFRSDVSPHTPQAAKVPSLCFGIEQVFDAH